MSLSRTDAEAAIETLGLGQRQGLAVDLARLVTPFWDLDSQFFPIDLVALDQELEDAKRTLDMVRADDARHALFRVPNLGEEPEGLTWFAYRAVVAHIYAADALTTAPRDGVKNVFLTVEDILDNAQSSLGRMDLLPLLYALVVGQPRPNERLSALIPEVVQALGS